MSNADMKKSTEELKKEYKKLHKQLEKLKEEMEYYASPEGGSRQTREGCQEIM